MASLELALKAMAHRGPDAQREVHLQIANMHVQLGHRRLSILDLSTAADQPLDSDDGLSTIVFNGEIYNHHQIRQKLLLRGLKFKTRSDTEVLLSGMQTEGLSLLPQLNGMFAFAVVDQRTGTLLLARDPFGIKPLYFARLKDGGLVFASELKALAQVLDRPLVPDPSSTAEFLLNGFLYEPRSGFVDVEKLQPGHALTVNIETMELHRHQFYDSTALETSPGSTASLIDHQLGLEVEADVPVGVFFSGGIDSSVLAAAAPRSVEAFFVDYGNGSEGDADAARKVAAQLKIQLRIGTHRDDEATPESVLAEFCEVALGTEEPISDYTYVATRMISRAAREAGFKVMLSGMGGDELFAGYPRHQAARAWPLLHRLSGLVSLAAGGLRNTRRWSKRADRLAWFAQAENFGRAYTSLIGYFSAAEVEQLLGSSRDIQAFYERTATLLRPVEGQSLLRQAMHLDRHGFLAHNLTVTDRASMAASIEVRVPLLSTPLERHVRYLPDEQLRHRGSGKLPLKKYLLNHLTRDLIERPKVGFNPPLEKRIGILGAARCLDLLTRGPIADSLNLAPVRAWIDEHFTGRRDHTYRLWQLLYYNFWLGNHTGTATLSDR